MLTADVFNFRNSLNMAYLIFVKKKKTKQYIHMEVLFVKLSYVDVCSKLLERMVVKKNLSGNTVKFVLIKKTPTKSNAVAYRLLGPR